MIFFFCFAERLLYFGVQQLYSDKYFDIFTLLFGHTKPPTKVCNAAKRHCRHASHDGEFEKKACLKLAIDVYENAMGTISYRRIAQEFPLLLYSMPHSALRPIWLQDPRFFPHTLPLLIPPLPQDYRLICNLLPPRRRFC